MDSIVDYDASSEESDVETETDIKPIFTRIETKGVVLPSGLNIKVEPKEVELINDDVLPSQIKVESESSHELCNKKPMSSKKSTPIVTASDASCSDWEYRRHPNNSSDSDSDNSMTDADVILKIEDNDSEDSDVEFNRILRAARLQRMEQRDREETRQTPKKNGDMNFDDLPPIEKLQITLAEEVKLIRLGVITQFVDTLVIVQSDYDIPPLDLDSVLIFQDRKPIGKIFEIFGPVPRPLYSIRFNSVEEIDTSQCKIGAVVYFAPTHTEITHTIFTDALMKMNSIDSGELQEIGEPPDFSDDEKEKQFYAKIKAKNRGRENEEQQNSTPSPKRGRKRGGVNHRGRGMHDSGGFGPPHRFWSPRNPMHNPWRQPFHGGPPPPWGFPPRGPHGPQFRGHFPPEVNGSEESVPVDTRFVNE